MIFSQEEKAMGIQSRMSADWKMENECFFMVAEWF
jgi:hypothetical protein